MPKTVDSHANRGLFLVILSAIVYSTSGLTSKWMPWNAISIAGFRAFVTVLIMAAYRRSFRFPLTWKILPGAIGTCATSLLFMSANKLTTAANSIVLQFSMPLFVILLNLLIFKKRPDKKDIAAVFFVAIGIVLCFMDNLEAGSTLGNILALASGLTYALVFFSGKMAKCEAMDYIYLGNLLSSFFMIFMFNDPAVAPANGITPWLVAMLMGIFLADGNILLAIGLRSAEPLTASIVSNIEPVLNPVWVFLFLGETPGTTALIGTAIVLITVTIYSAKQRA